MMLFASLTSLEAELENVQFEKLDFGETSVLDLFYNADVVIVDMSIPVQQSALFYHIGVRQSMEMKFNIVLHYDVDPEQSLALRVSSSLPPRSHPLGSITSPTSQLVIIPFFNSVFHSPNPQRVLISCSSLIFGSCALTLYPCYVFVH